MQNQSQQANRPCCAQWQMKASLGEETLPTEAASTIGYMHLALYPSIYLLSTQWRPAYHSALHLQIDGHKHRMCDQINYANYDGHVSLWRGR